MKVFFVGPFPMPLHGFSLMNSCVATEFRARGAKVLEFDVTPKGGWNLFFVVLRYLRCLLWESFSRSRSVVYIGLSGGMRQIIDLIFFVVARFFFMKVIFHHHSFAYINRPSILNKIVFLFIGRSSHVVLSLNMGRELSNVYGIHQSLIFDISNSFFIPEIEAPNLSSDGTVLKMYSGITLGYISNITRAKGIFIFFDLLERLTAAGLDFSAKIAGPVDPAILDEFKLRLSKIDGAVYLGAVYGYDKANFFASIDYLVFPTIYPNEAEPVSIIESLAYGVPVAALSRGCIPDMLDDCCGIFVKDIDVFLSNLVLEISSVLSSREILEKKSRAARNRFEVLRERAKSNFDALIDKI